MTVIPCLWCGQDAVVHPKRTMHDTTVRVGPCSCGRAAYLPPAGGWVLALPWSTPPLTGNQRLHWRKRAAITKDVRATAEWLARAALIPAQEHVTVTLRWNPPDRRRRDADNVVATLKALCDGLVDAGIVPDDTPQWMTKNMPIIASPTRPASMTLTITQEKR